MACFLVPMVVALITTIVQKSAKSLADRLKLWALNVMLWGGVILLMVEHMWHGELVPWPPFLTAMSNPLEISAMLHEIATIGTAMTMGIFLAWSAIVTISHYMPRMVSIRTTKQTNPL